MTSGAVHTIVKTNSKKMLITEVNWKLEPFLSRSDDLSIVNFMSNPYLQECYFLFFIF